MPSLTYQNGALVYRQNALGLDQGCCCDQCQPCEEGFAEEISATLTVYDGTAPFGGTCGGISGVYEMVLTLGANGDGWWGFADIDGDGAYTPGSDYTVQIIIIDCAMTIYTNIPNNIGNPAVWPPNEAGGYGFGNCAAQPDGALPPADSPYCAPPPGVYEYFWYLLEPLPGTPECDAKFCVWTLVIE